MTSSRRPSTGIYGTAVALKLLHTAIVIASVSAARYRMFHCLGGMRQHLKRHRLSLCGGGVEPLST